MYNRAIILAQQQPLFVIPGNNKGFQHLEFDLISLCWLFIHRVIFLRLARPNNGFIFRRNTAEKVSGDRNLKDFERPTDSAKSAQLLWWRKLGEDSEKKSRPSNYYLRWSILSHLELLGQKRLN